MHAAGVVADHSADGAVSVGGGIGAESQAVLFRLVAQIVEDDARLDPGVSLRRIELADAVHVLREIEHHGDVAALPGQGRASAAGQDRRAELARQCHGGHDVVGVAGQNDADGDLPVIGGIGGVERARAVIEAHFPTDLLPQRRGQRRGIDIDVLHAVVVLDARANRPPILERNRLEPADLVALGRVGRVRCCDIPGDLSFRHLADLTS